MARSVSRLVEVSGRRPERRRPEVSSVGIVAVARRALARGAERMPKRYCCLLYTSPSPRDVEESRMPSSA